MVKVPMAVPKASLNFRKCIGMCSGHKKTEKKKQGINRNSRGTINLRKLFCNCLCDCLCYLGSPNIFLPLTSPSLSPGHTNRKKSVFRLLGRNFDAKIPVKSAPSRARPCANPKRLKQSRAQEGAKGFFFKLLNLKLNLEPAPL